MRHASLTHQFVEDIPSDPLEGKLYISIRYRTAVHRCACGCGNKVVTPIRPSRWQLYFDGDSVSLSPSVGNWQFPCRSHYYIYRDKIRWAGQWTEEEIAAGRELDTQDLRRYYTDRKVGEAVDPTGSQTSNGGPLWRAWRRLRRRS